MLIASRLALQMPIGPAVRRFTGGIHGDATRLLHEAEADHVPQAIRSRGTSARFRWRVPHAAERCLELGLERVTARRFRLRDPLVQLLIHRLNRAIDLGIWYAELMRNQLHQEIDPLDGRRAAGHRTRRRGWL